MVGISFPELMVVIVVVIVFVPPKEWPKLVRFLTKSYKWLQDAYYAFIREINLFNIK